MVSLVGRKAIYSHKKWNNSASSGLQTTEMLQLGGVHYSLDFIELTKCTSSMICPSLRLIFWMSVQVILINGAAIIIIIIIIIISLLHTLYMLLGLVLERLDSSPVVPISESPRRASPAATRPSASPRPPAPIKTCMIKQQTPPLPPQKKQPQQP